MPVVQCPTCTKKVRLPETFAKPAFACPACGEKVKVPQEADDIDELEALPAKKRSTPSSLPKASKRKAKSTSGGDSSLGLMIGMVVAGLAICGLLVFFLLPRSNNSQQTATNEPAAAAVSVANAGGTTTAPATTTAPGTAASSHSDSANAVPSTTPQAVATTSGPSATTVAPAVVRTELQYKWTAGSERGYRIEVMASAGDLKETTTATAIYSLGSRTIAPVKATDQTASGTGFVVTANGYLVTCQHVVESAKAIQVKIGTQTLAATVVAQDIAKDIAILKVEAQGLGAGPCHSEESNSVCGGPMAFEVGHTVEGRGHCVRKI